MSLISLVDRNNSDKACRNAQRCSVGESLYHAGQEGLAWRVAQGVVRLDMISPGGELSFASLAISGDIIGCETMLFGAYTFSASALTQCELTPWPEGNKAPASESLLQSLASSQKRAAEVVALRGGEAVSRVMGLVRLLASETDQVVLPTRQDIAEITDLRFETISRVIKRLERAQILLPRKLTGIHATRSFDVDFSLAYP